MLFVSYGAGHIRTILPVVRKILKTPESMFEPILLALTTAAAEADAAKTPYIGFADLGPLNEEERFWGQKLAGPKLEGSSVSYEESVAYHGRSFLDLVIDHGEKEAFSKFKKNGRAAFFPIHTAKRTIDLLNIDAVVATNSPRAEHAFLEAARQKGLPTIVIWSTLAKHEISWVGKSSFSTKVCVDSNFAFNKLLEAGRSNDEIVITGNPQFDVLKKPIDKDIIKKFRTSKGWADTDKVLLFAQQNEPIYHPFTGQRGNPNLPRMLNEAFLESLKNKPKNIRLCIRYHPNQEQLSIPVHPLVSVSEQGEDLSLLLHSIDAVFTCSSTVAYQGAIIGKPIIQGLFSIFSRDVEFDKMVGAMTLSDFNQLENIWFHLTNSTLPSTSLPSIINSGAENVLNVLKDITS